MKEIGGYFGLEDFVGKELYADLIALNSARNALVYLIRARKIEKLYIPYYLCDSVSSVCERERCSYEYYNIGEDMLPLFDRVLGAQEYFYFVNYFGQFGNEKIKELHEKYGNMICDNVQAFFSAPLAGIDTVYSCRKFFGVPDGGYLSTDAILKEPLSTDVSMSRMKHVLGRFEGACASDYYADFRKNDESFADMELRSMSKLTRNIMRAVDYEAVRKKREENFAFLHSALGKLNAFSVNCPAGPYVYPFYCKEGMAVKKRLAEKKIYVATLWPEVIDMAQVIERDFAENILPLPCDQRYGAEDMQRIIFEILNVENSN